MNRILVTGAAGFIGSALVRELLQSGSTVIAVDKLTYAGSLQSLRDIVDHDRFQFIRADIVDRRAMDEIFAATQPGGLIHLAAESHVDRSIEGPADFITTNIVGTFTMLEAARDHLATLAEKDRDSFRFHHVSTDEVYGDLDTLAPPATEDAPYRPGSPYSASKSSADHLVRAWSRTYGLPVIISTSPNNCGPRQFPEKLIPHVILSALSGKDIPVYGDGKQIRDWLYVEDHAAALATIYHHGKNGETYHVGGGNERRNLDLVHAICDLLEQHAPDRRPSGISRYRDLITHVKDRPGHDRRYALDSAKLRESLAWTPRESFETALEKTVLWYLENETWWRAILSGDYRLERLG